MCSFCPAAGEVISRASGSANDRVRRAWHGAWQGEAHFPFRETLRIAQTQPQCLRQHRSKQGGVPG